MIKKYADTYREHDKYKMNRKKLESQNFSFAPICSQIILETDIPNNNEIFERISPISNNNGIKMIV